MRNIAQFSGAKVTGITINGYVVSIPFACLHAIHILWGSHETPLFLWNVQLPSEKRKRIE